MAPSFTVVRKYQQLALVQHSAAECSRTLPPWHTYDWQIAPLLALIHLTNQIHAVDLPAHEIPD